MKQDKYIYDQRYNRQAGERQRSHTRTNTQKREMETLPETLGLSTKQSQPSENLQRAATEKDKGEGLGPGPTTLRPRQKHDPSQSLFLSSYSPRRERRYNRLHHFILCLFGQIYASIT